MAGDDGLSGRRIVLTGASAGVGRATALRLAEAGARIALIAREPEALAATAREVEARGGEALALPCDVADADAVLAAADRAAEAFGGIDVWINDAMATVFARVGEIRPEEFRRVTEVCYLGTVHGTMAALRHMAPRGEGTIVNVGSALAYRAIPLQSAYCGAKHAIRGFSDALRAELRHDGSGIRVTLVHLPAVNTPQFDWARVRTGRQPRPAGTVHTPEAAAEAVVRAVRRPVREYWVGWQSMATILANTLAPGLLDRYLARTALEGQMTGIAARPDRRDNLFAPVEGMHAVRGSFAGEARRRAPAVPAAIVRFAAVAAAAAAIGAIAGA